ncbi:MAG: polysaccharide deacetylase family protein, partial [Oscillibacter sp.]|nr:polysaccharide deacetylase family protein [Oscillibacter sp.]
GITAEQIRVDRADVRSIYEGHEIAVHTLTHPNLLTVEDDAEVLRQIEQDRLNLSELAGYEVFGMAYPGGGSNCDDRVAAIVREQTPIRYARTLARTKNFDPWPDLYQYRGTLYHHADWDLLFDTGRRFLELEADRPQVFYIWGHAYEFDFFPERWEQFEAFCAMMSGRDDIFYGTNLEVLTATAGEEKIDTIQTNC